MFILPDQLRADFVGCYGADFAKTPNIDALAQNGVMYNRCISPSPICVPARASMLTGENALANNVLHNGAWLAPNHEECGLHTWPKILSEQGYNTVAVGKMHFYPWDILEGFQERIISEDKRHVHIKDDYAIALAEQGHQKYHGLDCEGYVETKGCFENPLPKALQADTWICDKACDYIKEYKEDQPFAMMVGLVSPHCPYDPDTDDLALFQDTQMPAPIENTAESDSFVEMQRQSYLGSWCGIDYKGLSHAQKIAIRKHYSALIYRIDACVGKLIKTLKEKGVYQDTVIIFASDHGDMVGDYSMVGKHLFYEPSVKVPFIVQDPALQGGVKDDQLISLTDVRAAILHIAGVENTQTNDSILLPCYQDPAANETERYIFGMTDIGMMITSKQWKYCRYANGQVHLFDLYHDKEERINLAGNPDYTAVLEQFNILLQKQLIASSLHATKHTNVFTDVPPFYQRQWTRPYPVEK